MSVNAVMFNERLKALGDQIGIKKLAPEKTEDSFQSIFQGYIDMLNETSSYQAESDKLQIDFATGKTDDMLAVMLAQEKATASLTFAIQVTNKILEAYKEIMRTQL